MTGYLASWNMLEPRKERPPSIEVWMTLRAVITPMTLNTPIVTPSIVRMLRSLFARSASSAIRRISFIAERFDGIETARRYRRREAAHDARDGRDEKTGHDETE